MGSSTDSLESILNNTSNPQHEAFLKAFNELTALGALRVRMWVHRSLDVLFSYTVVFPQRVKLAALRALWGPVKRTYKGHRLVRQSVGQCRYKRLRSSSRCQGPHLLGSPSSQLEK
jgi:hypothetical protein